MKRPSYLAPLPMIRRKPPILAKPLAPPIRKPCGTCARIRAAAVAAVTWLRRP